MCGQPCDGRHARKTSAPCDRGQSVCCGRRLLAIAERMPDVGRRYYKNVLEKTINRLASYLEAHVKANDLAIEDCQLAAWQFMQMCQATLFQAFIFQAKPSPSPEQIATVVDSATRVFLTAYRAKRD